jgi:hypothetical protein
MLELEPVEAKKVRFRCVVTDIVGGKLVSTEADYALILAYAKAKKKENENLIITIESVDGFERYAILDKGKKVNRLWHSEK